jgi:hypothetical protein
MRPEDRNPAYLWDMLQAAREVEAMLADHDLAAFPDDLVLLRAIIVIAVQDCTLYLQAESANVNQATLFRPI